MRRQTVRLHGEWVGTSIVCVTDFSLPDFHWIAPFRPFVKESEKEQKTWAVCFTLVGINSVFLGGGIPRPQGSLSSLWEGFYYCKN